MEAARVFIEKKEGFRTEADSLKKELNTNLNLNIRSLRLINIYDLFGFSPSLIQDCSYKIFAEPATDDFYYDLPEYEGSVLATEYLPGQFDQRAASAEECVKLLCPDAEIKIRSGRLLIFDNSVGDKEIQKISSYIINPVESRIKNLSVLSSPIDAVGEPENIVEKFTELKNGDIDGFCKANGLAMSSDDLITVVNYFIKEGRNPTRTELKILDTYWSDHCRHTTFSTILTNIEVEDSQYSDDIRKTLNDWKRIRKELGREDKNLCLMDLATIGARYLIHTGHLDNLEISEENNACSIIIDVETDQKTEKWLLQFKNETHNHPTEIEPFGGAATCLGGAIRDPLSGRAYVYQAMRVSGAANIYAKIEDTIPGKLPQKVITLKAASGYSSYGNQIGLATTHVREIYHPGYVAKRLEVGAVVGAVKASDIKRETPRPGDVILMLGGRTGRDGIGGATGSSKKHTETSVEECGSEVQKGNPPEERKIQRLFRRPEAISLIKKSNDFGAGGVSVAIGELAPGIDIYLDRIKTKYSGLSATDLAISESQERMAVVISPEDKEEFERYCREENIEVTHVADVTDLNRMRMFHCGQTVADLCREFIDSAGAPHYAEAIINAPEKIQNNLLKKDFITLPLKEKIRLMLSDPNVVSQKGLVEMFDSSIGASTVLMPYGGKNQRTETQVSVQTLPNANTPTASLMAFGFNPYLSECSPYHGSAFAVVEAVAKAVAAGVDMNDMRFSYQEYFERMTSPSSWGKPLTALLGALRMQLDLSLPAIGGKDSMSGTFDDINVPPTLIAFGVAPIDSRNIISTEFKGVGHNIFLLEAKKTSSGMPDTNWLKKIYADLNTRIKNGEILSAWALGMGGLAEALIKMSFGNGIGADIKWQESQLFDWSYGSILLESKEELPTEFYKKIGETVEKGEISINGEKFTIEELYEFNRKPFIDVYPDKTESRGIAKNASSGHNTAKWKGEKLKHPKVCLPVFPGTNCDFDMAEAFKREGAETQFVVFRNQNPQDITESIDRLAYEIDNSHILVLSGGFSAGDEPDGSGKFIANVLMNDTVKRSIEGLLRKGGLILGICNGFQALIKSGLLPFGKIGEVSDCSPTLMKNDINRHISQMVTTRVSSVASPWLDGFSLGDLFTIAASHGEGKFVASEEIVKLLDTNGQIAFQYADPETGNATMKSPWNPNGSVMAIEGIVSPDGLILGKMAHSERYREGLMKNIPGEKNQNIFKNAVKYFEK